MAIDRTNRGFHICYRCNTSFQPKEMVHTCTRRGRWHFAYCKKCAAKKHLEYYYKNKEKVILINQKSNERRLQKSA